jgi:hypothetical protein
MIHYLSLTLLLFFKIMSRRLTEEKKAELNR